MVSDIDFSCVNPATGPVYVRQAVLGSVLEVKIEAIGVRDWGVICTMPGIGPLTETAAARTRIVPVEHGVWASFSREISIPLRPMIGVIGVAPADGAVPCGQPGDHGGNLDTALIGAGTTVYLPVRVEGALFALGDLHASMGDGEICGTGIETAGYVDVWLNVRRGSIVRPVVETAEAWHCLASDPDLLVAVRKCTGDMQRLLVDKWQLDPTDAYQLMSVAGDLQISQACKPSPFDVVARFRMPKLGGRPPLI